MKRSHVDGLTIKQLRFYHEDKVNWAETDEGQLKLLDKAQLIDGPEFHALVFTFVDRAGRSSYFIYQSDPDNVEISLESSDPFMICFDGEEAVEEQPSNTESSSEK